LPPVGQPALNASSNKGAVWCHTIALPLFVGPESEGPAPQVYTRPVDFIRVPPTAEPLIEALYHQYLHRHP